MGPADGSVGDVSAIQARGPVLISLSVAVINKFYYRKPLGQWLLSLDISRRKSGQEFKARA